MKRLLPLISKPINAIVATFILLFLTFIVAAQSSTEKDVITVQSAVTVIGWISLSLSALASAAAVVYGVIKRKSHEELKEARDNFKSLAESYKEKMTASQLENADLRAKNKDLEGENENLAKKILRQ